MNAAEKRFHLENIEKAMKSSLTHLDFTQSIFDLVLERYLGIAPSQHQKYYETGITINNKKISLIK